MNPGSRVSYVVTPTQAAERPASPAAGLLQRLLDAAGATLQNASISLDRRAFGVELELSPAEASLVAGLLAARA